MINLTILFGGKSNEHDISILSAKSIMKYINRDKYNISLIYIDKDGEWYRCFDIEKLDGLEIIDNYNILNKADVVFPVLHGRYGEDGTIQGLMEVLGVKYVGCGIGSSLIAMDKELTKIVLNSINIPQAKYISVFKDNYNINSILDIIDNDIHYPIFIKPARSGSSVGINKVYDSDGVEKCIQEAFNYDDKVIIEEYIEGREIEVGILGNDELIISDIGEIKTSEDFYSYDSKYKNKTSKTIIPALIDDTLVYKIKACALEIYRTMECRGLARLDFFVNKDKIIFNEINTMPGFTNISMYPMLFENIGIDYSELIDRIIELGMGRA